MPAERVVVGFIPLLDCAALVAAAECGFAAQEGLDLRLVRETSWANIRDRLIVGQFDAAHMLAPMVIATTLGVGHLEVPLIAPVALGSGGNAITLASRLRAALSAAGGGVTLDPARQGAALRAIVRARAESGEPPLRLAMVYPFSCHNYELRYWLAASGIDPDEAVRLVVMPPPLLVDALREGQVDGFCVGEPWSSVAVAAGVGDIVTTGTRIWPAAPEKVLGLRRDVHESTPERTLALVRAIVRGAAWCERPGNREELARLLAGPRYVGVPASILRAGLEGSLTPRQSSAPLSEPQFLSLWRNHATFPWRSHPAWLVRAMERWGQATLTPARDRAARASWRPDLYRRAVEPLRLALPPVDERREAFFDGAVFDAVHDDGAPPGPTH